MIEHSHHNYTVLTAFRYFRPLRSLPLLNTVKKKRERYSKRQKYANKDPSVIRSTVGKRLTQYCLLPASIRHCPTVTECISHFLRVH